MVSQSSEVSTPHVEASRWPSGARLRQPQASPPAGTISAGCLVEGSRNSSPEPWALHWAQPTTARWEMRGWLTQLRAEKALAGHLRAGARGRRSCDSVQAHRPENQALGSRARPLPLPFGSPRPLDWAVLTPLHEADAH